MQILVHVCCAPCLSGSRIGFENEGIDITGYWFNPNIQPWTEYQKRRDELKRYQELDPIRMEYNDLYPLRSFIEGVLDAVNIDEDSEKNEFMMEEEKRRRCGYCYKVRMLATAKYAKENGFDGFSTTLLLSKYQDHDMLKSVCEEVSKSESIPFYYMDLRKHWGDSLNRSRKLGLFRQNYCGCIFSEQERYRSRISPETNRK